MGRRHLDVCGGVPGSGDPQCAVSPKCNASCITRAQTTPFPSPLQCMFIAVRPTEAITVVNGGRNAVSMPKCAPGGLQMRIFTLRGTTIASVLCEAMLIAKIHHACGSDSIRFMGEPVIMCADIPKALQTHLPTAHTHTYDDHDVVYEAPEANTRWFLDAKFAPESSFHAYRPPKVNRGRLRAPGRPPSPY